MKTFKIPLIVLAIVITVVIVYKVVPRSQMQSDYTVINIMASKFRGKEFWISYPLNGKNFSANRRYLHFDSLGNATITANKSESGIFVLVIDAINVRLVAFAGDKIEINIEGTSSDSVTFSGTNAEGQSFFNSLRREGIHDISNPYKNDNNAESIKNKIFALRDREFNILSSLLRKNRITLQFADLVKLDIAYYYATSLSDAMWYKYYQHQAVTKGAGSDTTFDASYMDMWQYANQLMPLNDTLALRTMYFKYYAANFYDWKFQQSQYKIPEQHFLDSVSKKYPKLRERIHVINYYLINRNFVQKISEYLKAQYLFVQSRQGMYESSLVNLFERFTKEYNESIYLPLLEPEIDKIRAYENTGMQELSAGEQILPGQDTINSLRALFNLLKGKPYYVDIWAVWCSPCKAEFRNSQWLHQLLDSKNIGILYLSIDRDKDNNDWLNMIKYYTLTGLHVRANDSLRKDIYKQQIYTIPRYMLVDKNGNIVNNDAARPSDSGRLVEQLKKVVP